MDLMQFQRNRLLSELTTFGIGGPANYYIEIRELADMQRVIQLCQKEGLPFFILGKGSNVLFEDRGYSGVMIANRIDFIHAPSEGCFYVGAGYSFSLLGTQTARQGWSGLEFASGIPGSVGGAVYMNAGANGHEVCETIVSVDYIEQDGTCHRLSRSDIAFKYRYSSFQDSKGAIVAVTFQLQPSQEARKKQLDIIQYRKATQPYGDKSAGCIFRNPIGGSAGALIDKCGLKGLAVGGAHVSAMHANFIVNKQGATTSDVLSLIDKIRQQVYAQTGLELEPEVRVVPYE